ncbi:MAG: hypothetical protein JWO82_4013 [Akkermansiaceae bacterium]|nr:hypothetical protein [Akkermansiaceae bacterium]
MKKFTTSLAALAALSALAPMLGNAAITTIGVTGWNQDIVINNGGGTYDTTITGSMDNGPGSHENWTWGEAGTYPLAGGATQVVSGLTQNVYTSATGSGATFQFQDFAASNALLLNTTDGTNQGTLTLTIPTSLNTLALYGSTSGGPTSATVTLHFSDSTTSVYTIANGTGIGGDWFNDGSQTAALIVGDRVSNRSDDGYTNVFYQSQDNISIYESSITLNGDDQAKQLVSFDISNTGQGNLAIMAVSGQAVPEASAASLIAACGLVSLLRRRRA